jgi:hypothetical protein
MFKQIEARLVADWRWVVKRSWSVRFLGLSCLFEGANAVLPRYETFFNYNLFSVLTLVCTVGALASRFIAQEEED